MSFYRNLFRYGLSRVAYGSLKVAEDFSGGESYTLQGTAKGYTAEIRITDTEFYRHCVLYGEIGFGEAYVEGMWESDDLNLALRWFAQNARFLPGFSGSGVTQWFMNILGFYHRIKHFLRPNTQKISRRNIAEHYDIGNGLYELMLGKSMAYSCGVFTNPKESLDKAQARKFALICEKLQLKKTDHLLEIGSGWGGFAIYAAENYGCKITTVTISEQQFNYAKQKIRAAKLEKLIDLKLEDYRLLEGKFDKIVSIEMAEAIGYNYFDTYFKKCADLLSDDGLMLLQYITFPESRYEQYLRNTDFTQIYIFPGSCLLSNLEVMKSLHRTGDLLLTDLETIGQHYATTLRLWRVNVEKNREAIRREYSDKFLRKWIYYLCFCEAGFAERAINDVQVVFSRANTRLHGDFQGGDLLISMRCNALNRVCARWGALVAGLLINAPATAEAIHRFRGNAYDLKTGAFVYSENHTAFHKGNNHIYSRVSYRDKTGHEFASKLITFTPVKTQPTYELNDSRDGYMEGIRREGGKTVYYARRARDQQTKSKAVSAPQPAVFDAGFDYFVQEHFDAVCAGNNKSFYFAVPVELDYFKFRIARKSVSDVCHVYLELDNVLLRQVVKPIKLWYDMAKRRLIKYEGISNINGSDGKSMYVRVVFTYQDK